MLKIHNKELPKDLISCARALDEMIPHEHQLEPQWEIERRDEERVMMNQLFIAGLIKATHAELTALAAYQAQSPGRFPDKTKEEREGKCTEEALALLLKRQEFYKHPPEDQVKLAS